MESRRERCHEEVADFDVPVKFQARLDFDTVLAAAFHALTLGRQRGYLLHLACAKREVSSSARVPTHAPEILAGLGLDD